MCLACAVCALALPAGAAAKPGYFVSKPTRFLMAHLHGSNGYKIDLYGIQSKLVFLTASKGRTSISYGVRGKVTNEKIEAEFEDLGRVAVRLHPSGQPEESGSSGARCKGRPATAQNGRFVGVIRFRGEGGYTRVQAEGARGTAFHSYRRVCRRDKPHRTRRHKHPPMSGLSAASSNRLLPWFAAFKEEQGTHRSVLFSEKAIYTANQSELREGMGITRTASVAAPPETFAVSSPGTSPTTGTVTPPAPFTGTATYEKVPGGSETWTGDLEVELPGLGRLPLTGPTYRAKLCRSFGCICPPDHDCGFLVIVSGRPYARLLQRRLGRLR